MPPLYVPPIEEIIAHSFKDLHVRGFDYLCLLRRNQMTVKVYLFDGDVSQASEVVHPHDHRYDFETHCLAGRVTNFTFLEDPGSGEAVYQRFAYRTPLNGGGGFEWVGETNLAMTSQRTYDRGGRYGLLAQELHTIRVEGSETAILLYQHGDLVPLEQPTSMFSIDREPPSLSGLYSRFTPDEVRDRLRKLERLGVKLRPRPQPVAASIERAAA